MVFIIYMTIFIMLQDSL